MNCPYCNKPIDEHPASRCLDAWVAELVMRWEFVKIGYFGHEKGPMPENPRQLELEGEGWLDAAGLNSVGEYYIDYENKRWVTLGEYQYQDNVWQPSTSIAAAWEVVEKLYDIWEILRDGGGWVVDYGWPQKVHGFADTAPLAISRAAIKACADGHPA